MSKEEIMMELTNKKSIIQQTIEKYGIQWMNYAKKKKNMYIYYCKWSYFKWLCTIVVIIMEQNNSGINNQ